MAADAKDNKKEGKDNKDKTPEELGLEIERAARAAIGRKAGPLDRAIELFWMMGLVVVGLFFWSGAADMRLPFVLLGVLLPLSFLGGILSNASVKIDIPPASESPGDEA